MFPALSTQGMTDMEAIIAETLSAFKPFVPLLVFVGVFAIIRLIDRIAP